MLIKCSFFVVIAVKECREEGDELECEENTGEVLEEVSACAEMTNNLLNLLTNIHYFLHCLYNSLCIRKTFFN